VLLVLPLTCRVPSALDAHLLYSQALEKYLMTKLNQRVFHASALCCLLLLLLSGPREVPDDQAARAHLQAGAR
jgi:hypothetical protein